MARTLVGEHFAVHGLPHQIHSDNGLEFVNSLWKELFSEFKILHTTTPAYNPSSNIIERFHRTLGGILRCMGGEIVHEWDLSVKSAVLAYNTTVHSSTGVTPFYAMYGREAILPVDWVYPTPDEREQSVFLDRNFAEKVSGSICRYEAETKSSSSQEHAIVQTSDAAYQGRKFGVAF